MKKTSVFNFLLFPLLLIAISVNNVFGQTASKTLYTFNGNIGIGTTTPQTDFQVIGTSTINELRLFNGDIRFGRSEDNVPTFQKKTGDAWQDAELRFGPNTVFLGDDLRLGTGGQYFVTSRGSGTTDRHVYPHKQLFTDGTDLPLMHIVNLGSEFIRAVIQPDDTGEQLGTTISETTTVLSPIMVTKGYVKIGSVGATAPVLVEIFEGLDDTGVQIYSFNYPASVFATPGAEISAEFPGFIEFLPGITYFVKYSSPEIFSLKANAAGTKKWVAFDYNLIEYDTVLNKPEWVTGDYFSTGDWIIEDVGQKIYVCNSDGTQTGTLISNLDKWDALGIGNVNTTGTPTVDNSAVRYDGTTGNFIQESSVTILDNGNVGIGTTTPSRTLEVLGNMHEFGCIYVVGTTTATIIDAQGDWVEIDAIDSGTSTPGIVVNGGDMTINRPGDYMILINMSVTSLGANQVYEFGTSVNDIVNGNAKVRHKLIAGSDVQHVTVSGIMLDVIAGDVVKGEVRNLDSSADIIVENYNFTLIQL